MVAAGIGVGRVFNRVCQGRCRGVYIRESTNQASRSRKTLLHYQLGIRRDLGLDNGTLRSYPLFVNETEGVQVQLGSIEMHLEFG